MAESLDPKGTHLHSENPYQFAAKRFTEMTNLLNVLKEPKQTKLVFQSLPKHMRRRAATHNPKRLPRRLRGAHISQFKKSGIPVRNKRPTRKYRRKPGNLKAEYAKRSGANKPGWLETHLWHAKRFHMITRWGYRLPWSPCDKSYRACYRATTKYCLMQDVSYLVTLQISGPIETLKTGFRQITSQKCGPTLNAKYTMDGKRQGETFLFEANQYPLGCLGKVTFFWIPQVDSEVKDKSTIWMNVHPAAVQKIKRELMNVFKLQSENDVVARNDQVELRDMADAFNRFRLSGPLAHSVVMRALKGVTVNNRTDLPFHEYLSKNESVQDVQQSFWTSLCKCNTIDQVPSNLIMSLVVEDPRLNRPSGKMKEIEQLTSTSILNDPIPELLNKSIIFERELLESVTASVMSNGNYCKSRKEFCVVPGQRCPFEDQMQVCPILLIQRPGDHSGVTRSGFNSGWDVIVPKGYGSIFWLSFIMWGARAGGLREDFSNQREAKQFVFMPDTEVGQHEAQTAMMSARETYFRRPCNKRTNYIKLAVASPFLAPWKQLLREWGGSSQGLFVLRDRLALEAIQAYLSGQSKNLSTDLPNLENALIPVTFKMSSRGRPGPNSIIYLPNEHDNMSMREPIFTEPPKKDPFEVLRKKCRSAHLRLLVKMRRKRVKAKRLQQRTSTKRVTISKPLTEQLIADQHKKMCDMWLPSTFPSIRKQSSRETIGYCTTGDFSLLEGTTCGTGYVTFNSLSKLATRASRNHVLIRDPKSRQYRGAKVTVATFN